MNIQMKNTKFNSVFSSSNFFVKRVGCKIVEARSYLVHQSVVSRFCGHYCVLYCILRSRGMDMCSIVSSFTRDTGFNDVLVHGFVCVQ